MGGSTTCQYVSSWHWIGAAEDVGARDGRSLRVEVGLRDGTVLGRATGDLLGTALGIKDGIVVIKAEGLSLAALLGSADGDLL